LHSAVSTAACRGTDRGGGGSGSEMESSLSIATYRFPSNIRLATL
jgi:hypothetical protein